MTSSIRKFTAMTSCIDKVQDSNCELKTSGQKCSSNNSSSRLNCRRRNSSSSSDDSDRQCMLIEPQHSKSSFAAEAAANSVVFCEIQSCATRSSHSADSCLSTLSGTCCEVLPNLSPFPRFPQNSNFNHRPEVAWCSRDRIYEDLENAGHNSEYQWEQAVQSRPSQQQYWQPLQQSNKRKQPQKNQRPSVAADSFMQKGPSVEWPTEGIYSPARARNTTVHRNKWASRLDDSVLLDDVTPPPKRAQRKKRPQSPA
uniref:Uncharacterized protein n=1 Tax=Macrostomum lignano TaxID=282301 RepID=A0A1I8IMP2_9PLAT